MRAATKSTLIVDFSTTDPDLERMLRDIASYPDTSSCRHELEAALYGFLHDKAIKDAASWREIERAHEVRNRKREERRGQRK